ncbi:hypothetical protein BDU57DRAFT_469710 [Ampelomyces quisqualis]|uniref:BZIP domain-containing protein n=1 Tax=Ampelomyces quisqualis TaxID=50730 RepID=A0A6A5QXJ5_AMPQU|nr:hypothetical protein BDU57DRAFT_469710 [Ampelomyces quisqualis]
MTDARASQKAQNLARIRDNQRRSRARRKEYLQELEAKIRACEQVGIEASSEIQSAARKVVEENRMLRSLLHKRGVSKAEIMVALGGPPDRPYEQTSAAPYLSSMLERRITCNALSSTSSPAGSDIGATSMPRQMPCVPSVNIPVPLPTALSCCDSPSPSSVVSSTGTPPPVAYSTPFYSTPVTPTAPDIKSEDVRYGYSYDQPYNDTWHYSSNDYNLVQDSTSYYNNTSSVDAANIIKSMKSDVDPHTEASFGGRVANQHCYMDNNHNSNNNNNNNNMVYNIMGRYPSHHSMV